MTQSRPDVLPLSNSAAHASIHGTALCVLAAVAYSTTNVFLRRVAEAGDTMWVVCVKESVSALCVGPWLLLLRARRPVAWPSAKALTALVITGLMVQLGGNMALQWSFGAVGLTIAIPVTFSMILVAGAVLGRVFLGERLSLGSAAAIVVLTISLLFLSLSAESVSRTVAADQPPSRGPIVAVLGVAAACLAGCSYGGMSVVIRRAVSGRVPPLVVVFIVTGTGTLLLGPLSIWRMGLAQLVGTPSRDLALMLSAGAFNLLGFVAFTQGLKRAGVVHANLINSSQVALCAIAGIFLFAEPPSMTLGIGVTLTLVGLVLSSIRFGKASSLSPLPRCSDHA